MPFQPEKIKRSHVLKAFKEIDNEDIGIRPSTKWDIVYQGKRYPPKDVGRLAHEYATGEYFWQPGGGEGTNKYFKKMGFLVVNKTEPLDDVIKALIPSYKHIITANDTYEEIYKWEAVGNFQKQWDLNANDLVSMIDKSFPGNNNLWTSRNYYPINMLKTFAENNSPKVRDALQNLFDENSPLDERISAYQNVLDELLREDNVIRSASNKHHYHDARTISLLLSFQAPTKYFLFKHGVLKKFCARLEIDMPKTGDIVNQILINNEVNLLVKEILVQDKELLEIHKNRLTPNAFKNDDHNILTQDFIYSTSAYTSELSKYWLFAPGENAREWDDFYEQGIMALGWDDLGDLTEYSSKQEIVKALQNLFNTDSSKKNDATANYDFMSEMNIGDVVFVKKGTSKLLGYGIVESDYLFDAKRSQFKHVRKMNWKKKGLWDAGHNLAIKTLTNISDYPSPDTNYSSYHERLMSIINGSQTSAQKTVNMDYPLNAILYGPPGTGKTYKTIDKALNILNVNTHNLERKEVKKLFEKNVEEGRIVFTTFHQSMSYEDFVEGIKPVTINEGQLVYNVESGIFKTICKKAEDNYWNSQKGLTKELPFDKAFEKLEEEWQENEEMKFPLRTEGYDFTITGFSDRSIRFKKASGGTGHTLSISTLRDVYYGKREVKVTGVGIYYPGILAKLKSYKPEANSSEKDLKNYVLIIDEINRGNVSAIFGELITLLEPDKRLGADEEITVKLPYSKDETFGVPPNLYIIGTMNTADRSVEALDTALRRRFVFEEVMPDPTLLSTITFDGFNLEQVLTTINDRIEALLDRDHTIGHSYFIKLKKGDTEGLSNVFKNNIIPLLQEYFYNDYEKIALVLGSGFVEEKGAKKVNFPKYNNIAVPDLEQSYELITNIDDIEEAVGLLLGNSHE
jgi:5-methylcytosine-specific restriction protein B